MKQLKLEERELLAEFIYSDAWTALMKQVDQLCTNIDNNVLKANLDEGPDKLLIKKARSEGARQLQIAIIKIKQEFKAANGQ